jgi:hypothetical protein
MAEQEERAVRRELWLVLWEEPLVFRVNRESIVTIQALSDSVLPQRVSAWPVVPVVEVEVDLPQLVTMVAEAAVVVEFWLLLPS